MDEVQIEIKDEFIHQDEELQTKKKSIASSSKGKTNVLLNEEVHIENESIDQGFILPLTDQENTLVQSETIELNTDLKTEVKQENFWEFDYPFVAKSELTNMKTEVKTEVKEEPFEKFEAREQGGIDFITSKDFDHSLNESEFPTQKNEMTIEFKTEVKIEVKEEPFEKFESREQDRIDLITSKDFDQNVNKSEFPTQKTDFAIKRKFREEPNKSNVPLKKFKQDCNQSNHYAKSERVVKKTDLNTEKQKFCPDFVKRTCIDEHIRYRNKLQCSLCPSSFEATVDLKRHFSSTHEEAKNQYECQFCPETFVKKMEAYKHLQSIHAITKFYQNFIKHMNNENEEDNQSKSASYYHECSVCSKVFVYACELKSHYSRNHTFKCQFCSEFFSAPFLHLNSVHAISRSACPGLVKNVDLTKHLNSDKLVRHYAKIHEFDKPITAHDRKSKKKHISSVHSYKCQFCTTKFQKKEDMNQHEKIMHSLQCRFCLKRFAKKEDIDYHVNFVHTSKCRFCPSKFETKDDMNEHISLVHSFNCQSCTAKFQTSKDLRQHETLMHKFQCQFCPKKFAKKKHMDDHATFIHQNMSC